MPPFLPYPFPYFRIIFALFFISSHTWLRGLKHFARFLEIRKRAYIKEILIACRLIDNGNPFQNLVN